MTTKPYTSADLLLSSSAIGHTKPGPGPIPHSKEPPPPPLPSGSIASFFSTPFTNPAPLVSLTSFAPNPHTQEENTRLLENNAAITGVLLAIDAAIESVNPPLSRSSTPSAITSLQFNSSKGLQTHILLDLIIGFSAALELNIYYPAYDLAETLLYIFSTKRILPFSEDDVAELEDHKVYLTDTTQVKIIMKITEVQEAIIGSGETLETTEDDIVELVFPLPVESTIDPELTKIEALTNDLEAMCANSNGLELSLEAISYALKAPSSSDWCENI